LLLKLPHLYLGQSDFYEYVKVSNFLEEMQRQSLDLWMDGKSPTETFNSLSETHNAFTNETYMELMIYNMRANNDGLEFYYFKLLVDKLPIYLTPKDLQSYLIDFVTNEPKYGTQMVPFGWMSYGKYVNNVTNLKLPLAAPILYDIFNMISWPEVDVVGMFPNINAIKKTS
jgi:hypothetical protein